MTTNQTLWLDTDGLHVGGTQLITTGGGVGMGTSSIYGALTVAGTATQAAAVFWGNVGIGSAVPQYVLDITGNLNSTNYSSSPGGAVQTFGQSVNAPYVVPVGKNALSVGNLTIATGANVTVQSGSRWVIV